MFGFGKKKKSPPAPAPAGAPSRRGRRKGKRRHAGPYTPEQRRQAVEAYLKSGMTQEDFARTWGITAKSLIIWLQIHRDHGPKGLEGASLRQGAQRRGRKGLPVAVKQEIRSVKEANPELGSKSVRNFLFRFRGVKVSNGTVRKTLKESGFPPVVQRGRKKRRKQKKPKVQRFERARAMQLWQTDITSFMLTRHSQRVYLTVFMDDHSRYVVSWSLALQQTKEFVMETLLQGISRFGKPEEVLTDQGRQYYSWRGKSDFRKLLKKQGIQHVVARAHHPETVGKCERFWETVQNEFWDRVEPQDLSDARARFEQFVAHYNHFRPHQGLDGLIPADRFFGAAQEVRQAIEETVSKNALRLAVGEAPRKPVFLIGQIGETPVSLHGEKGRLVLQTPDGQTRRLDYEDFGHAQRLPTTNAVETPQGEKNHDSSQARNEPPGRSEERAPEAKAEPEVPPSQAARLPREGALGAGDARAAQAGARGLDRDHGVLAGPNHEAGCIRAVEDAPASHLAAVATGDIGDGGRTLDPAQDPGAPGIQEPRNPNAQDTEGSGERSAAAQKEDRETRSDDRHAKSSDRGSQGDAGLPRCEDSHGGATGSETGSAGGSPAECSNGQESDEPSSDRSSS